MIFMQDKYEMINMTRDEIKDSFKKTSVAVLPIGALEQHGHHLPLGTDIIIAEELGRRVCKETEALLLPAIPFGYSWVWRNIPGTITLKQHNVEEIIKDTASSLDRYGVKNLIVINGHDANNASMKYAARELEDEIGIKVIYIFYPDMNEVMKEIMESDTWYGLIHACEFETSLMLAINPELVNMDKAVKEYPDKPLLYGKSTISLGDLSKSGVYGDSTRATQEKGEKLLNIFTKKIVDIIKAL